MQDIEIRLYNYVPGQKEMDLIDSVRTNAKGKYKIEIPNTDIWYTIDISFPNYESYRTNFIMFDENPILNATLVPVTISEEVTEVSSGVFVDSPVFIEYNMIEIEIEQMNIVSYFSTLIYEHYNEKERKICFGNVSDEKIEELISEAKVQISKANTYIDSMLVIAHYSQSVDYLLDQKIYLKCVNMESFMFTDFLKLFKQISNLNFTKRNGSYKTLMWYPEFQENEVEYLKMIKEKIINSYDENKRDHQLFYYYYALSQFDQYIYKGKKYSPEILQVLTEIEPNLPDLKDRIEKLKNKINLIALNYAPDFNFTDLYDNHYKLSDFRGKWVFLDFWATWCAPCEIEIKNIQKIRETFSTEELVIIGIAWEDDIEKVKEYTKKHNENWITTLDSYNEQNSISSQYGVSGIPSFFLIDTEGKLVNTIPYLRGEKMYLEIQKCINEKNN